MFIYDVGKTPFTFKFDETPKTQVKKKQYGGYLQYWSSREGQIVNVYVGSLFMGYCDHKQLVQHYKDFENDLNHESSYLLHICMDGPSVNSAFENKPDGDLSEK